MDYEQACKQAATDQGLDPITDELARAGIPHTVDQTGGFVMCINVPLVEGGRQWLYLTSPDDDGNGQPLILIGRYWDCEGTWCDGSCDVPDEQYGLVHLNNVVRYVRREAARSPLPCPYCDREEYAAAMVGA